ncbi:MAG TPA: hypothetical protein VGQ24_16595 [Gemmatimonadales bacterium]|jgi:hypothetical protein|nr:hypothetical protein [Gemmatimonadales bacterium]
MAVSSAAIRTKRRTRRFYVGMAVAFAITVFAGFSRSYFLKAHYGTPELSLLLHAHGLVFTTWVLFFLAQTTLVAAGRTYIHRRMGVAGAVLAGLVLIMGTTTAILRVKGGAAPIPGVSPLSFLAVPLFDMVVFAILIGTGLYFRRRLDTHKRLMTLATISLLSAPIARLPFGVLKAGPPAFFGLTDLFIVALLVYDLATRRRVHPATVWGGLLIVASQPLRLMISGTPAWLAFAGWLTR